MNCSKCKKLLNLYLDREIEAKLQKKIEEHLASCPECRAKLDEFKAVNQFLAQSHSVDVPEELVERVRMAIYREANASQKERFILIGWNTYSFYKFGLAIAACLAIIVAGVYLSNYLVIFKEGKPSFSPITSSLAPEKTTSFDFLDYFDNPDELLITLAGMSQGKNIKMDDYYLMAESLVCIAQSSKETFEGPERIIHTISFEPISENERRIVSEIIF